ncbi:MAG TPA: potassium transporter TrkG, partial [Phycisphaerae bacterium]|nr:potassium transporter TrkG [Phycisphaerae bacterium]
MNGRTPSSLTPRGPLDRARPYIVTAMVPIVVLAVGSLVLEYGFHVAAQTRRVLQWIEVLALAGLMLEPLVSLLLARDRREMLRARWFHYVLAAAFAMAMSAFWILRRPDAPFLVHRAAQLTILVNLAIRLVELNRFLAVLQVQPAMLVAGSFLTLMAVGTGLLLLPTATAPGEAETTFMDALFTAASAVCVTGLTVVNTGTHWAPLGRYVILVLIQLGGLGLMTFASVFALLLWRGMRVRELVVMREVLSHDLVTEVGRIVVFILLTTLCIEAAGALLLSGLWDHTATGGPVALADRIVYSIFHSVSAFCNAGFTLYGDSLKSYRSAWQVNVIFPLLIISGGIGFAVLYNLARLLRYRLVQRSGTPLVKKRVTLQTKMAVVTTAALLVGGTLLGYVFEAYPGEGPDAGVSTCAAAGGAAGPAGESTATAAAPVEPPMGRMWTERLGGAWFLATTARTAGFNTTDTTRLAPATKVLTSVLMFIGASPGGTGGGI